MGGGSKTAPNWIFAPKKDRPDDTTTSSSKRAGGGADAEDVGGSVGRFIQRGASRSKGKSASAMEELGLQRMSQADATGLIVRAATGAASAAAVVYGDRAFGVGDDPVVQRFSPRRTMAVLFTCNVCGTRTERRINPKAYSEGTVFVQCSGCEVHHKLVDNLNLYFEGDHFLGREAEQAAHGRRLDASELIEVFPRKPTAADPNPGQQHVFRMWSTAENDDDEQDWDK